MDLTRYLSPIVNKINARTIISHHIIIQLRSQADPTETVQIRIKKIIFPYLNFGSSKVISIKYTG